jgi:putative NIF3 family GTP cyclohydrolase 1 type 2
MKLERLYRKAVEVGIRNDLRGKAEIKKTLEAEKEKYEKLKDEKKITYDQDRLFNPFADTRILSGPGTTEVKKVILGIDMEVGEVVLTHLLNRDLKQKIDLIIAHHPEGLALAQLYDVMKLQTDLLASCGVSISVAEQLMERRILEIERRLLPVNHNRAVDAAKVLGLPMMCVHTPADNCVTRYLKNLFEAKAPRQLKDLVQLLMSLPEYQRSAETQVPPKIVNGEEHYRCGKIFVDMTGGTEGSKEIFEKLATSGVSTVVGMHFSEEFIEKGKASNVNMVIAGHISSDVLGLNLLFDEIEKEETLDFVSVSGFMRFRRR